MDPETTATDHPYVSPAHRWLIETTQAVINGTVYVDRLAEHACSVDPESRLICLQEDLTLEQLLHVLPRAALVIAGLIEESHVQPFPLRLVANPLPDQRAG